MKLANWPTFAPMRLIGPTVAVALSLGANFATAAEEHTGWSLNFTPVIVAPKAGYHPNSTIEFVFRSILIGAGATMVMDIWAAVLRKFGVTSLNFAFLGRWIGHLRRGRWFHESIAKTPSIPGELFIGWFAHYSIGVSFAALLLATNGLGWAQSPTLPPALVVGVVTVIAPWFILQPALGAGIASSRTPTPLFNAMKSLTTHLVFGIGLFVAARTLAALLPVAG